MDLSNETSIRWNKRYSFENEQSIQMLKVDLFLQL